jgi:D-beta-D-heptose 7-phosphate kinase/D-beta-D-heptose 1-phosphate adenosyltransferase
LALVGALQKKKVVVIGDLMLDVYIRGAVARISPEAPIPVVEINEKDKKMPGGAANVAANITALGGRSAIIGSVGQDQAGKELIRELKGQKVETKGVIALSDRPTTEKTRVIAHTQQVVRIDREVKSALNEKQQDQVIKKACEALKDADGVIFEDYNKGLLTTKVIRKVIAYAKAHKKIITVDPKFHNFFEFKGVTVMKPNMKEVTEALGTEAVGETFETIGAKVMKKLGCRSVVLTRSEHGMTIFEMGHPPRTIPTFAREVFDVSGAGDTVIATLTLALTAGASLLQAAALANYAAGIEVEKLGVATVSAEELSQRLLEEMNR